MGIPSMLTISLVSSCLTFGRVDLHTFSLCSRVTTPISFARLRNASLGFRTFGVLDFTNASYSKVRFSNNS